MKLTFALSSKRRIGLHWSDMIANPYTERMLQDIEGQDLFENGGSDTKVRIFQTYVLPF